MTNIIVNTADGEKVEIDCEEDESLMEGINDNDLDGVDAICGGVLSCATCHVYIDEQWAGKLPPKSDEETALLEGVENLKPTSRLSCQINISDEIEGMIVTIPAK